ncbi:hypothetical protein ACFFIS_14895 [Virgibacillus soli]|uniref:hypothetical protein n=1 Tax=Paracerasibacillus soli TaxID=480284 RepID=UPI0035E8CC08
MRIMEINEEAINQLVLEKVDEHIRSLELEEDVYFMDARQLEKYLSLSWPTISKVFLSDPDFPTLKKGKCYMFHKKDVDRYLDRYYEELKHNGRDILKYRRKG